MLFRLSPGQSQPTRLDCGPTGHAMDTGFKLSLAYFLEPTPKPASAGGGDGGGDGDGGDGDGGGGGGEAEGAGGSLVLYGLDGEGEGGQLRELEQVVPALDRLAVWQSGLVSNERTPVRGGAQLAVLFWIHGIPTGAPTGTEPGPGSS